METKNEIAVVFKEGAFNCTDRTCYNNGLHLNNPSFECTLKKVVFGKAADGHWCKMYKNGIPEWSRLQKKEQK
jgi:hypothetical protein